MGKRWDVTKGDSFMVLDKDGRLIRGVQWADEDAQIYGQFYLHHTNFQPSLRGKHIRCAFREGIGPFTVISVKKGDSSNRLEYLTQLIHTRGWKFGAEIGVCRGKTGLTLINTIPTLHMVFVDFWPERFASVKPIFCQKLAKCRASQYTFINKPSVEGAKDVLDESLDFVFIDADHSYESCSADIIAWLPKVKSTGMILGHDANWDGVEKAYTKLLKKVSVWRPDEVWYANKSDQIVEVQTPLLEVQREGWFK